MATDASKDIAVASGDASEASSVVVVVTPAEGSNKVTEESTTAVKDEGKPEVAEDKADESDKKNESGETEEKTEEKVMVGMLSDFKNLYQKWDRHNRYTWSEKYPDELEEAAENEETIKFALLVRNKKSYDSRKKLEIDSIVVQSPLLKKVLAGVLQDYPGVTTALARLTFSAPFRPFVHRWDRLQAALNDPTHDDATRSHVKVLHDVLSAELKDVIEAAADYAKNGVVTFEHIWTIFQPGCTVVASRYGQPCAVRLREAGMIEHQKYGACFQLKCDRLDWDGSKFGFDRACYLIMPFVGTVPISELEAFPLEFHPQADALKLQLLERGRRFESFAGQHFKAYRGIAIEQREWGPAKVSIESRIIIDAYAHAKSNPNNAPQLRPLTKVEAPGKVQRTDGDDDGGYYQPPEEANGRNPYFDAAYDEWGNPIRDDQDLPADHDGKAHVPLTEEQLILCTPTVRGYALKSKKWLEFYVDHVEEVVFDEGAFDSLVLPPGHKSLVLALAQSQVNHKERFDDVVSGKGKGVIMLLSGGPGIGKTLTAEAVAEHMRRPLYAMSAGALGTASWEVENTLSTVLEMVAKWNAVLLLDECDVFLQARNVTDLDRNRIVSVFLRTLEYYEGVLFLTTNRVMDMDPAFHSRIHVHLEYPALDQDARRQVWQGFLDRADAALVATVDGDNNVVVDSPAHELTDADVRRLAALEINGRQIKNVLKTAHLLASNVGDKLTMDHITTVLRVEGYTVPEAAEK